jgi:hypothetical protein
MLLPPQGIYMLQDNSFRWLLRVAPAAAAPEGSRPAEYLASVAQPYLELPCGIIRGRLQQWVAELCSACNTVKV